MDKRWKFLKKHKDKIIIILLLVIIVTVVISVMAVFGGAVMRVFGFEYESVGSIILFFLIASVLSAPFGLVSEALPKALLSLGRISKGGAVLLYIVLDTTVTATGLALVDHFMGSVQASDISIVVVSFLFSLFEIKDIVKEKGEVQE